MRGRQIWVYYTHMADPHGASFISSDFPSGTYEKPVEAGTVLGRQGDYSGDPNNPVGVHLHISIVKDNGGRFTNELDIQNTYDPSPYFGLALNAQQNPDEIPVCRAVVETYQSGTLTRAASSARNCPWSCMATSPAAIPTIKPATTSDR